uniref:ATP-dependent zinc metalloprotease FtsH n=1 Tax=Caulerpa racemosa TaxID=76317 RepID=A0A1I9LK86_CAURA|nr:ATP-dependent zinc metalloprotease FtsH [Caulerpa racemosa]ANJ70747.1 ATP-dependent zinc metalloprotease FtsH [Caulerpa racemosa]
MVQKQIGRSQLKIFLIFQDIYQILWFFRQPFLKIGKKTAKQITTLPIFFSFLFMYLGILQISLETRNSSIIKNYPFLLANNSIPQKFETFYFQLLDENSPLLEDWEKIQYENLPIEEEVGEVATGDSRFLIEGINESIPIGGEEERSTPPYTTPWSPLIPENILDEVQGDSVLDRSILQGQDLIELIKSGTSLFKDPDFFKTTYKFFDEGFSGKVDPQLDQEVRCAATSNLGTLRQDFRKTFNQSLRENIFLSDSFREEFQMKKTNDQIPWKIEGFLKESSQDYLLENFFEKIDENRFAPTSEEEEKKIILPSASEEEMLMLPLTSDSETEIEMSTSDSETEIEMSTSESKTEIEMSTSESKTEIEMSTSDSEMEMSIYEKDLTLIELIQKNYNQFKKSNELFQIKNLSDKQAKLCMELIYTYPLNFLKDFHNFIFDHSLTEVPFGTTFDNVQENILWGHLPDFSPPNFPDPLDTQKVEVIDPSASEAGFKDSGASAQLGLLAQDDFDFQFQSDFPTHTQKAGVVIAQDVIQEDSSYFSSSSIWFQKFFSTSEKETLGWIFWNLEKPKGEQKIVHILSKRKLSGYFVPDLRTSELFKLKKKTLIQITSSSPFLSQNYQTLSTIQKNFKYKYQHHLKKIEYPLNQFFEVREKVNNYSWSLLFFLSTGWVFASLFKDLYKKYGKEILESCIDFLQRAGIFEDVQWIKEELGMAKIDKGYRGIRHQGKKIQHLIGLNRKNIILQVSDMIWFLKTKKLKASFLGLGDRFVLGTLNAYLGSFLLGFQKQSPRLKTKPKGFLFAGPPGTGKTLLVQAIAGETGVPVVTQSGGLLQNPRQRGRGARTVQKLFRRAREIAPCIVFIDEVDGIGARRQYMPLDIHGRFDFIEFLESETYGNPPENKKFTIQRRPEFYDDNDHYWKEPEFTQTIQSPRIPIEVLQDAQSARSILKEQLNILTQLLIEMDGINPLDDILIIGATNRLDILDPALLRPGRFQQILTFCLPDYKSRIDLFKLYTKSSKIGVQNISWDFFSKRTHGLSSADIASIVFASELTAIEKNSPHTLETLERGIDLITSFPSDPSLLRFQKSCIFFQNKIDWFFSKNFCFSFKDFCPIHPMLEGSPTSFDCGAQANAVAGPSGRAGLKGASAKLKLRRGFKLPKDSGSVGRRGDWETKSTFGEVDQKSEDLGGPSGNSAEARGNFFSFSPIMLRFEIKKDALSSFRLQERSSHFNNLSLIPLIQPTIPPFRPFFPPCSFEIETSTLLRNCYYNIGKMIWFFCLPEMNFIPSISLWDRPKNFRFLFLNKKLLEFDEFDQKLFPRKEIEKRFLSFFGGKAVESLFIFLPLNKIKSSQLANLHQHPLNLICLNNQIEQSNFSIEDDMQTAQALLKLMIEKWYFYLERISLEKFHPILENVNSSEYQELETDQLINHSFFDEMLIEIDMRNQLSNNEQKLSYQAWWMKKVVTRLNYQYFDYLKWSRIYLSDPLTSVRNVEWVEPDEFYHTIVRIPGYCMTWTDFLENGRFAISNLLFLQGFNIAFITLRQFSEFIDYLADYFLRIESLRETDFKYKIQTFFIAIL